MYITPKVTGKLMLITYLLRLNWYIILNTGIMFYSSMIIGTYLDAEELRLLCK